MRFALPLIFLLPIVAGAEELAALNDPSRGVREAAVGRLAASELTVANLIALLGHDEDRVRRGVCRALALRGDPSAIPALMVEAPPGTPEAIVDIAERNRLDLPAIALLAKPELRVALEQAHAARVHALVARGGRSLDLSRPQSYRRLFAGGVWAERLLLEIALDAEQPSARRVRAVHGAHLMLGRAMHDDLAALITDVDPNVRSAARVLLWRLHTEQGNKVLAALLEQGDLNRSKDLFTLVSAAEQGGELSNRGAEFLANLIKKGEPALAADAGRVLLRKDRERAIELLHTRVRAELAQKNPRPAALFFLACGRPTTRFVHMASNCKDPLVRLAAEPRVSKLAPSLLKELLDPEPGPFEWIRVRVVTAQLYRTGAPWEDKQRFVRGLLATDVASWRASGLSMLRGAPADILKPLRSQIVRAMGESHESVRVFAAILLMPATDAQRVLWSALYDGDLRTAWVAGPKLDPGIGRQTPVAERRRRAREALSALDRQ